jgi:polyhydroxybutyrate depolymerase
MRLFLLLAAFLSVSAAQAGDDRSLSAGGHERTYHIHRPAGLGSGAPLVIVLHGGFGTGRQAQKSYHWDEEADRHGFVVAYPDGHGRSWNAGGLCCGPARRDGYDDVAFLTALMRTMERSDGIDPKRIYLTGISNGAAMSYRYACEGELPVAAVGAVSGSFSTPCPHPHATSVMEIHGLQDRNIPFSGGHGAKAATDVQWLPVEETLGYFRAADDCAQPTLHKQGVVETAAARCAAGREVTLITISDAGHQWPGSTRPGWVGLVLGLDPPSTALDATPVLWRFFAAHALD